MMTMDDRERRLRQKRTNERVKLTATFFNGMAIANVIVVILSPLSQGSAPFSWWRVIAGGVGALISHLVAQATLRLLRSED